MSGTGQQTSIIHTLRENIIKENNTANETFAGFLKTLNKETTEINVNILLQGDLDLSILKKNDFNKVDTIAFIKGDITNVINVPENIKTLNISNNLLIEMNNLPKNIKHLDIKNNYITELDLKQTPNLEELNCQDNQLREITNIPATLVSLLCSHNKLKKIDLKNAKHLKILRISYNPFVVIENLPENITVFEKDETADIIQDNNEEGTKNKTKEKMKKIDFLTALNSYFELKNKYEMKFKKKKEKLKEKEGGNIKIYKEKLKNLKNKCIKCNRPVGTIFAIKDNVYTAVCGDKENPCELNISLYRGDYLNIKTSLYNFKDYVDEMKEQIIKQKMDTLFNYISEKKSIELFKEKMEAYKVDAELYEKFLLKYKETYENKEKKENMEEKNKEIQNTIKYMNDLLKEYEKTNEKTVLQTVVNIYQKELVPKINFYNNLKYEIREMIKDDEEGTEKLYQETYKLKDIELMVGEEYSVIRYNM